MRSLCGSCGSCLRCHKAAYMREWNRRSPETKRRMAAQQKEYRAAHKAALKAKSGAYYVAHREPINEAERTRRLAERPVVYVWMAPDGQADWVGRGVRSRARRTRGRSHQRDWWTPEHILLTMTCDTEWQAMEFEGRWGAHYLPRGNVEGYRHQEGYRYQGER